MNETPSTPTIITDIDIPFGRLVAIMLKLMLASIPAVLIHNALMFAFGLIMFAVFGRGSSVGQQYGRP